MGRYIIWGKGRAVTAKVFFNQDSRWKWKNWN